MKEFSKYAWVVIFVMIYAVAPDLLPGPLDDVIVALVAFNSLKKD